MNKFFPWVVTLIAACGGLVVGFDAGWVAVSKEHICAQFGMSNLQWSYLASMSVAGALMSIMISGKLTDHYGSKNMLAFAAVGFGVALFELFYAHYLWQLFAGRCLVGICTGITAYTVPLYLSEIAPKALRGQYILWNGLALTLGQTASYWVGYIVYDISATSWRYLVGIQFGFTVLLISGMLLLPQSPRFAAKRYGMTVARDILLKIRGKVDVHFTQELQDIEQVNQQRNRALSLKGIFSVKYLPVMMLGAALGIFQQCMGINAVMFYGPVIFKGMGFVLTRQAILATFYVALFNFFCTLLSWFLIDRVGRRAMLLWGSAIATISLGFLTCMLLLRWGHAWIGLLFMLSFIGGYCISLGSLFWVMIAEIYPLQIRGSAMSFATLMQCLANLLVSLTFLQLLQKMGLGGTFGLYALMSLCAFVIILYYVPETKGVSLELIEKNVEARNSLRKLGDLG